MDAGKAYQQQAKHLGKQVKGDTNKIKKLQQHILSTLYKDFKKQQS